MIKGIGIDIVEVDRIRGAINRHGERFLKRIYCPTEIQYCRRSVHPCQKFAARFAAKEAVMKALGTGWQHGVRFVDIRVIKQESGAPALELSGKTLEISKTAGVEILHLSLSHTKNHAAAQVVAEGS